jgi:hypothetical protein
VFMVNAAATFGRNGAPVSITYFRIGDTEVSRLSK